MTNFAKYFYCNCYHPVFCVSLQRFVKIRNSSQYLAIFLSKLVDYVIFHYLITFYAISRFISLPRHKRKLDEAMTWVGQIWNSYLYWNMIGLSMSFKLMIWQNPWKPRYKTLVFLCHIFLRMGGPATSLLSLPHTRNNRKFYLFTK